MMKTYSVRRYWTVCDVVTVEAEDKFEANGIAFDLPPTDAPEYLDDSMNNDEEIDVVEGFKGANEF